MTLESAIQHCEEVAEEQDKLCKRYDDASGYSRSHNEAIRTNDAKRCEECAKEHRQLAEWLKELKEYRKNYTCFNCYNSSASFNDYPCCECRRCFKALDGIEDHYEEVNANDSN